MSKEFILINKGKGKYDESNPITPDDLLRLDQDVVEDKNFIYDQGAPAIEWVINHNLNKKPSVVVIDTAGSTIEGEIIYIDNNNVTVRFNSELSGTATLN